MRHVTLVTEKEEKTLVLKRKIIIVCASVCNSI